MRREAEVDTEITYQWVGAEPWAKEIDSCELGWGGGRWESCQVLFQELNRSL